ncbi:MAG: U32 family peptidase C-terminal domain-containing protein, partial [Lachnospiraceae bacterium]|nr:U32 family peptidase C-terminal domain-containing protein [Lachnospiraceae bacterium]
EETRTGEYLPVEENERGTFLFNSKDLCMIGHIPDLLDAGIDSLKIEGRMKNALYVATVARTYRKAIDDCQKDPALYEKNMSWYQEQIASCTYRPFTTGFFYGKPDHESQIYDSNTYIKEYTYLGIVGACRRADYVWEKENAGRSVAGRAEKNAGFSGSDGWYSIEQRNKFTVGERIEVMKPDGENIVTSVLGIRDEAGNVMESAPHPKQKLWVKLGCEAAEYDILRRAERV